VVTIIGKRGVSTAPNAILHEMFVSDFDLLKSYLIGLAMIGEALPRLLVDRAERRRRA
jgi:hypothetical protein